MQVLQVQVPPEAANFSLKITALGELCCVALPCLSKHPMDD